MAAKNLYPSKIITLTQPYHSKVRFIGNEKAHFICAKKPKSRFLYLVIVFKTMWANQTNGLATQKQYENNTFTLEETSFVRLSVTSSELKNRLHCSLVDNSDQR